MMPLLLLVLKNWGCSQPRRTRWGCATYSGQSPASPASAPAESTWPDTPAAKGSARAMVMYKTLYNVSGRCGATLCRAVDMYMYG